MIECKNCGLPALPPVLFWEGIFNMRVACLCGCVERVQQGSASQVAVHAQQPDLDSLQEMLEQIRASGEGMAERDMPARRRPMTLDLESEPEPIYFDAVVYRPAMSEDWQVEDYEAAANLDAFIDMPTGNEGGQAAIQESPDLDMIDAMRASDEGMPAQGTSPARSRERVLQDFDRWLPSPAAANSDRTYWKGKPFRPLLKNVFETLNESQPEPEVKETEPQTAIEYVSGWTSVMR